jgi:hypothetical protein
MNAIRAALIITTLLLGCTSSPKVTEKGTPPTVTKKGTPQGELAKSTIGAAGGSLTSVDGKAKLTVPVGALSADAEFGLQALSSVSPGAIGSGWRLTPDGQTFSTPVKLEVAYTDGALAGVPRQAVAFATQRTDGVWQIEATATLDDVSKMASATISHFSDWSLVFGVQMRPASATVKVGKQLPLNIAHCFAKEREDDLAWIGYECDPTEGDLAPLLPIVKTLKWSVNGVEGGDGTFGTVKGADNHGIFDAPQRKPVSNLVAVSAEVALFGAGKTLVVSNVTVTDDGTNYAGTFNSSLNSADVTYALTGDVVWEQVSTEKFRASQSGAGELRRFPSLGYYTFAFALEPFEINCNGVPVPVNLLINPCDNFGTLLIDIADPASIHGTGTCGPQLITWAWNKQ